MDHRHESSSSTSTQAESDFLALLGTMEFAPDALPPLEEIKPDGQVTYHARRYGNILVARVFSVVPVDIVIDLRTGGQIGVASGSFDAVGQPVGQPWRIMGSLVQGKYLRVRGVVNGDRVEHRFVTAGEADVALARLSLEVVEPFSSEVVTGEAVSEIHAFPILRAAFQAKVSANGKAVGNRPKRPLTLIVNMNGKDHVDNGLGYTSIDVNDVHFQAAAALHARIASDYKERVRLSVAKVIFP